MGAEGRWFNSSYSDQISVKGVLRRNQQETRHRLAGITVLDPQHTNTLHAFRYGCIHPRLGHKVCFQHPLYTPEIGSGVFSYP